MASRATRGRFRNKEARAFAERKAPAVSVPIVKHNLREGGETGLPAISDPADQQSAAPPRERRTAKSGDWPVFRLKEVRYAGNRWPKTRACPLLLRLCSSPAPRETTLALWLPGRQQEGAPEFFRGRCRTGRYNGEPCETTNGRPPTIRTGEETCGDRPLPKGDSN
jgi:hypothetical protein